MYAGLQGNEGMMVLAFKIYDNVQGHIDAFVSS